MKEEVLKLMSEKYKGSFITDYHGQLLTNKLDNLEKKWINS